jgi:precorrin-6B methylase 2
VGKKNQRNLMRRIPYPKEASCQKLQWADWRYTPPGDAQLVLELISRREGPLVICEIGCNEGVMTFEIARAFPQSTVIAIDHPDAQMSHPQEYERLPAHRICAHAAHLPNVIPVVKDMSSMPAIRGGVDVVFIDGDHSRDGCLRDTRWAMANGAKLIIWHDCREDAASWIGVYSVVEEFQGTAVDDSWVAFLNVPAT